MLLDASATIVFGFPLPTFADLLLKAILGITAISIGTWRLRQLARSLDLARLAANNSVVLDLSRRYDDIMNTIPSADDPEGIRVWWYRYWDFITLEFMMFRQGGLDPAIYLGWLCELAVNYNRKPSRVDIGTYCENHSNYLAKVRHFHPVLDEFYRRFRQVSELDDSSQPEKLAELVSEYQPKQG